MEAAAPYPFLKTELTRQNPERPPGVTEWQIVVPPDFASPLPVIQAYVATLEAASIERE